MVLQDVAIKANAKRAIICERVSFISNLTYKDNYNSLPLHIPIANMTLTNSEIKNIKSLSSKKFRDELGLFVVEGEKMTSEAEKSSFEIERIYRKDEIGQTAMSRISSLSSPSPVLTIVRQPRRSDAHTQTEILHKGGLFLFLDSIRDPGNLGTILRIADWFGIDAVFASEDTVEVFNPKVVQATMGAIFRVSFHYADLQALSDEVKRVGGRIYGTFLDGDNIYRKDLSGGLEKPTVIVIGNESNGISHAMSEKVTDRLFIPPYPVDDAGSESLNAAVATAVTVAEFRRQQNF